MLIFICGSAVRGRPALEIVSPKVTQDIHHVGIESTNSVKQTALKRRSEKFRLSKHSSHLHKWGSFDSGIATNKRLNSFVWVCELSLEMFFFLFVCLLCFPCRLFKSAQRTSSSCMQIYRIITLTLCVLFLDWRGKNKTLRKRRPDDMNTIGVHSNGCTHWQLGKKTMYSKVE